MDLEAIRKFCLSLPHATEGIQWEDDLLFRIGGKMFAGLKKCVQNDVPLRGLLQADLFEVLVENALGLAHHLG